MARSCHADAAVGLDRDPAVLRGRVIAAVGLTVLTVADAGLPGTEEAGFVAQGTLWRPLAAVVADPMLGPALLLTVGR